MGVFVLAQPGEVGSIDDDMLLLPDGTPVLAGVFDDPLRDSPACLIEYLPPAFVQSGDATRILTEWAAREFPDCTRLLVRLPSPDIEISGFVDHSYYVVLDREPVVRHDPAGIAVRAAEAEDRARIARWLEMAFDAAGEVSPGTVLPGNAGAIAEAVLDNPLTRSLVAICEEEPIGHATLLLDQHDDLTETSYVELLDVLVDRMHPRRHDTEAALVRAAWTMADSMNTVLLGHVVCHGGPGGTATSRAILDRLTSTGWTFGHKFQCRELSAP